jgi:hypothetical protein
MPWNWQSRPRCDWESVAGSLRNRRERDPANTRHTFEPVPWGRSANSGGEPSFAGASPLTRLCQNRTGGGSYLHIRRAVSHSVSSLRLSSSMERSFPTIEEAKPH